MLKIAVMNLDKKYAISPEVRNFLEVMGFGIRHVSLDGLRVILIYAILGYLRQQKSLTFLRDVAIALHNQTAIALTSDLRTITEELQGLKLQPQKPEAIQKRCKDILRELEQEHTNAKEKDTVMCCTAQHQYQSVCYHEAYSS